MVITCCAMPIETVLARSSRLHWIDFPLAPFLRGHRFQLALWKTPEPWLVGLRITGKMCSFRASLS